VLEVESKGRRSTGKGTLGKRKRTFEGESCTARKKKNEKSRHRKLFPPRGKWSKPLVEKEGNRKDRLSCGAIKETDHREWGGERGGHLGPRQGKEGTNGLNERERA